ncbi:hypothetical protein BD413DRAFT_442641, partial [Trametes elegans]
ASSSGGGGDNSQFLTSGTSALILAFLAIGLFIGGLLVMFAMRRYLVLNRHRTAAADPQWDWEEAAYEAPPPFAIGLGYNAARRSRELGAKPELYDLHAVYAATDAWEDTMPISARAEYARAPETAPPAAEANENHILDETRTAQGYHASTASALLHPFSVGMHDFISQVRPSRHRHRSPSPSPNPPLFPPPLLAERDVEPTNPEPKRESEPSHICVAVAIAMPMQRLNAPRVPFHALGVAEVKWSGGSLENLRR